MKFLSLIVVLFMISSGVFADDDQNEELPSGREILRSICIGIMHGGVCFGATLLLSLPVNLLLPDELIVEDPYDGSMDTGAAGLGQLVLSAGQETAFFHIVLQPAARSLIFRGMNRLSCNTRRNNLIARCSGNILSSICFGAAHLLNPNPSIFQVAYASLTACIDGELCYRYGRIAVLTSHVTFNILGFLLMRAALSSAKK